MDESIISGHILPDYGDFLAHYLIQFENDRKQNNESLELDTTDKIDNEKVNKLESTVSGNIDIDNFRLPKFPHIISFRFEDVSHRLKERQLAEKARLRNGLSSDGRRKLKYKVEKQSVRASQRLRGFRGRFACTSLKEEKKRDQRRIMEGLAPVMSFSASNKTRSSKRNIQPSTFN